MNMNWNKPKVGDIVELVKAQYPEDFGMSGIVLHSDLEGVPVGAKFEIISLDFKNVPDKSLKEFNSDSRHTYTKKEYKEYKWYWTYTYMRSINLNKQITIRNSLGPFKRCEN